jgi:hypothetical protein
MPYIDNDVRCFYDDEIDALIKKLKGANYGRLNYAISRIIWAQFNDHPSYDTGNGLKGVLQCVSDEFSRRKLAPYEDKKITENGDLPEA